jgi:DNA-binding CsgD family transcriptional regulator
VLTDGHRPVWQDRDVEHDAGRSGLVEPAEVADLRARSDAVRDLLATAARTADGQDPRLVVGLGGLVTELRRLEPTAERSAWVMQPRYFYDPEDPGVVLTRAALARGVQTLLVVPPSTVATHPLLPSIFPATRLAPVFLRAMVVDERRMLVEGRDTADGQRTSWYTARADVLAAMLDLWHRTLALATPILPPGTQPPLTWRQLEVARLVAVGEKDLTIARLLDLSPRTVEREVRAVLDELGARSRAEAVLLMGGRGVNGGRLSDGPT